MNWRLDVCYNESEDGLTVDEHLLDAVCLYGLADVIYCGLPAVDNLFGLKCRDLQFDALTIGERSGGYVSASSGLRFQVGCPAEDPVPEDVVGIIEGQEEGGEFVGDG